MVVSVRLCGKYRLRGLVVVGSAQTAGIRLIAATMKNIQKLIPLVREFYRHFDYPMTGTTRQLSCGTSFVTGLLGACG